MAWYPTLMNNEGGGDAVEIVTFESGTDEQIAAMLNAYYNDQLSWQDMGWSVGDTRKIHMSTLDKPNPNSSSSLADTDITLVIIGHDHTDLATSINGHDKACITVQTRECIGSLGSWDGTEGSIYIDGSSSKDTSFTKWSNLYMRTYLNNKVLGAIPNTFSSMIKPSKHYRHTTYNGSGSEEVTDNIFLPSYPEVFGTASYSNYVATSPTEGSQFEYYETTTNRIKYGNNNGSANSTAAYWWLGSASSNYSSSAGYRWCFVTTDGSAANGNGRNAYGLVPAFAL